MFFKDSRMKKCFCNSWLMVQINNTESILKFITFEFLFFPLHFHCFQWESKNLGAIFFLLLFSFFYILNRQMSDKKKHSSWNMMKILNSFSVHCRTFFLLLLRCEVEKSVFIWKISHLKEKKKFAQHGI